MLICHGPIPDDYNARSRALRLAMVRHGCEEQSLLDRVTARFATMCMIHVAV